MSEGLSDSVKKHLADFDKALSELEAEAQTQLETPFEDHLKRDAFSMLKVDTTSLFLMQSLVNSLFATMGKDPKENEMVQSDMKRVKELMTRHKQQEERMTSAPDVNVRAAKAFVRNALFDPANKEKESSGQDDN